MLGSEIIISSIRTSDGSLLAGFSGILAIFSGTLASFFRALASFCGVLTSLCGIFASFSSAGLGLGAVFGITIGCGDSFFGGSLLKRSRGSKRTATRLRDRKSVV